MYEDKKKGSITVDWKSLLIKLVILLVVVFIIVWIVSLFKGKDKPVESNLSTNLKELKSTAVDYFKGDNLPKTINGKKTVTLGELIDKKQTIELIDQFGEACNKDESYIEATKISDTNYTIKVKLVCGKESNHLIDTVSYENTTNENTNNEQNENNENNNIENNQNNNNTINNNTNTTNNNKPSTNNKPSSNNTTTKPNNNTTVNKNTCTYGSLNASSSYPVAYKLTGNCAVTKTQLTYGTYSIPASEIGNKEFSKLSKEMSDLSKKTGIELTISTDYIPAINKEGKGYVGYQIKYTVRKKSNDTIVYAYYIDSNYNRKVLNDNRNDLDNINNNNVTSLTLNSTNLTLDIDETYYLAATVKPYNTTYNLSYSSSNSNIVSVSSNGVLTAKKAGSATITVEAGNKTAKCYVTVEDYYYDDGYIDLEYTGLLMNLGETTYIQYETNLSGTPRWSSSNTSVASVNSYTGKITANKTGEAYITLTIDGHKANAFVRVYNNGSISFNYTSGSLDVGKTMTISYTTDMHGTPSWKSSNTNVATVDSNGKITGINPGTANITVTLNGKSSTIPVNVQYTKTYYLMTYVNAKGSIVQYFKFNNISKYDKIYALKVEQFSNTYDNDFMSYYSSACTSNDYDIYSDNTIISSCNFYNENYKDVKSYSLRNNNYSVSYNKTNFGSNLAVEIITNIKNISGATKYKDGYLVPVKVMISY